MNIVTALEHLSVELLKTGGQGTYKIILPKSDFLQFQYELTKMIITPLNPKTTHDIIILNLSGGKVYVESFYDHEDFK